MELFRLHGTIDVDNTSANQALDETSDKGQKTQSKLSKFFSGIGKGAVVVGKTVATGLAAGGVAMGTLTVKAMNLGGELEQNMGGSEAVFKEYAGKMQETAKSAFSNMGLSTSDYLATANKMGALFQGAGFDIKESMDLSTDAMQRAADVASIMGIDTGDAMEAIAGAAKGNFTMMDNLGVAMNDTTIQAYALSKGIDKSTSEMTNQEKIGLAMEMFMEKTAYAAGNYAKENETLAGSLGTAKAALTNFLDGSGDVESLVSSFGGLANVIVKNLTELAPRLISGLTEVINQIIPMLPPLLNQLLPVVIEGAVSLINGLISALPSVIDVLTNSALPQLLSGVGVIFESLISVLPVLIESLCSALPTLLPLLIDGLVSLIVTLCTQFSSIIQPIIDYLPSIIISIVDALISNLPILIDGAISLILGLVSALPLICQALADSAPIIIEKVVTGLLTATPQLISGFGQVALALVQALPQIFSSLWDAVVSIFEGIWDGIKQIFEPVVEWFGNLWNSLKSNPALTDLCTFIEDVWKAAKEIVTSVVGAIKDYISTVWNAIKNVVSTYLNAIKNVISTVWKSIKNVVSTVINSVKNVISTAWNAIKTIIANVMNIIFSVIKGDWTSVKNSIKNILDAIKSVISSVWNAIKAVISSVLKGIKSVVTSIWNGIKSVVSSVVNGIKSTISSVWNGIKSVTSSVWNGIKTAMTKPIEAARDKIKSIVDKVKGFFKGVKLQFPNVKLPHFGVTPSGWKIGDLLKGKIPKLSIKWYADAMRNPMIMTKPTVFGYDAASGKLLGGGEAGSEVVTGTGTLMRMIQSAVSANNEAVVYYLAKIVEILADYFPQLLDGFQNMKLVTDDGTVVAYYAPLFDKALGKIKERKDRGR